MSGCQESKRAWLLLILETPADAAPSLTLVDLGQTPGQHAELTDQAFAQSADPDAETPPCPHCGSSRTRFLGEWPRFGVP